MGTAMKHPVPDRVQPSFVIFDIRALWRSGLYTDLARSSSSYTNDCCLETRYNELVYSNALAFINIQ